MEPVGRVPPVNIPLDGFWGAARETVLESVFLGNTEIISHAFTYYPQRYKKMRSKKIFFEKMQKFSETFWFFPLSYFIGMV